MAELAKVADLLGVPEFFSSYIHILATPEEQRLILALQKNSVTEEEAGKEAGLDPDTLRQIVDSAYSRGLIDRKVEDGRTLISVSDFYSRLDNMAVFEPNLYNGLPREIRERCAMWSLEQFAEKMRRWVPLPEQGDPELDNAPQAAMHSVMLLEEIEEVINASRVIHQVDCDCRRLVQRCDKPVNTCLHFDNLLGSVSDRGHGKLLTKEEAKDLVRWSDTQGLVHCANADFRTRGPRFICNCDPCCCFPFNAALVLGSKGTYPISTHVAFHHRETCNFCGSCLKRCPFEAFFHDGTIVDVKGRKRKGLRLSPEKCWGCGLCANTCRTGAISMKRILER